MPPTLRASLPPAAPARRFTRWDTVVAIVLGLGLAAAGWADGRSYRASAGRAMATFGLVGQQGDTRIVEDEFFHSGAMVIRLNNVSGIERNGAEPFRHALGPVVTVETWSMQPFAQIDFILDNGFPSQTLTVASNGQTLEQLFLTPSRVERSYRVPLHPGANQFTITFEVYNHHGIDFENGETRPVAGTFRKLDVHF